MSKKSKPSKQKKSLSVQPSQAERVFDLAGQQMLRGDYTGAVTNYERLLRFLPEHSPLRVDVLIQFGTAHAMLQNFPQSYAILTEALELAPDDADLWYNRGMSSLYTLRLGRSVRDFTRAVELNKRPELSEKFHETLKFSREMAEKSIKLRGPDFTLDQLIEQEDLFQRGLKLMEERQWEGAEQAFQASIAMGEQPWGNQGLSLLMQGRYDEAEAALKRALEIDPEYTLAKQNLAAIPTFRRTGPSEMVALNEPFKHSKLKHSITFIKE